MTDLKKKKKALDWSKLDLKISYRYSCAFGTVFNHIWACTEDWVMGMVIMLGILRLSLLVAQYATKV